MTATAAAAGDEGTHGASWDPLSSAQGSLLGTLVSRSARCTRCAGRQRMAATCGAPPALLQRPHASAANGRRPPAALRLQLLLHPRRRLPTVAAASVAPSAAHAAPAGGGCPRMATACDGPPAVPAAPARGGCHGWLPPAALCMLILQHPHSSAANRRRPLATLRLQFLLPPHSVPQVPAVPLRRQLHATPWPPHLQHLQALAANSMAAACNTSAEPTAALSSAGCPCDGRRQRLPCCIKQHPHVPAAHSGCYRWRDTRVNGGWVVRCDFKRGGK